MAETTFIAAGSLIDGGGGKARKNVCLTVSDGIITAIGPLADLPENAKKDVIDLSHCTIVPALVDCSVSLAHSPAVAEKVFLSLEQIDLEKKSGLIARHIGYCHAHGVLGVAETDDISGLLRPFRETSNIDIRTSDDFLRVVYSSDIEERQTETRISHAELCEILQQKGQRKAIVVANGRKQVSEALEAGCDAIEQGCSMGEENLRKMADSGVLWIPAVLRAKNGLDGASSGGSVCCRFSQRYVAPGKADPGSEAFFKKILAEQLSQLGLARKLGVRTALGTGAGSVGILHGESMVEEMKLFIKAGYSLEETIRSASENGAGFFGMDKLGELKVGNHATFLVSRGSPQQLPRKLSYLENIYIDGSPSSSYSKNPFRSV